MRPVVALRALGYVDPAPRNSSAHSASVLARGASTGGAPVSTWAGLRPAANSPAIRSRRRGLIYRSSAAAQLDGIGRVQQFEQVADLLVHLGGMSHLRATVDRIVIAPAHPPALDEACLDEVGDDSLRGTLGDPDRLGHVARRRTSPSRAMQRSTWVWLVTNHHGFPSSRLDIRDFFIVFSLSAMLSNLPDRDADYTKGYRDPGAPLTVGVQTLADGTCLVSVWGEVDFSTAPHLERVLDEASRAGDQEVLVEFSRDSFIDSAGLHVLIQAAQRSKERGQLVSSHDREPAHPECHRDHGSHREAGTPGFECGRGPRLVAGRDTSI